jgi:hypothetical protein
LSIFKFVNTHDFGVQSGMRTKRLSEFERVWLDEVWEKVRELEGRDGDGLRRRSKKIGNFLAG